MRVLRNISSAFVLLGLLAGCSPTREPIVPMALDTAPAKFDWSKAERIELVLDSFEFAPDQLTFVRGQPYRLHLENHGGGAHNFDAPDFFRSLAMKSDATTKAVGAAGGVVEVPPGGATDVYFVPTKSGNFGFECSHFLHETFGMVGSIAVN